jgi:Flp pilus assembly protein TadB
MAIYTINATDRETGRRRTLVLEARDLAEAERLADRLDLAMTRIVLAQDQMLNPDVQANAERAWRPPMPETKVGRAVFSALVSVIVVFCCFYAVNAFSGSAEVWILLVLVLGLAFITYQLMELKRLVRRISIGPDERDRETPGDDAESNA